ncbi:MAG TPA: hypothetical protein VGC39_01080 [Candidatus Methylacidiphilales bacterium]
MSITFTKLFTSITESTIWREDAGRAPSTRPAAVKPRSDSPPDVVKINSLRAEIAALDKLQRREGFTNERNARHATLARELKSELRKFHVS